MTAATLALDEKDVARSGATPNWLILSSSIHAVRDDASGDIDEMKKGTKMRQSIFYAALLAASCLGAAGSASAQTIYTDRAAFLAATTNPVLNDFNYLGGSGSFQGLSYTDPGGNFTLSSDADFISRDPASGAASYDFNSGDVLSLNRSTAERFATFTPAAGVTAFGFDYSFRQGFESFDGTVGIGGVDYTVTGRPTFNFFGIVDSSSLAPIVVNFRNGQGVIDNVVVATAAETTTPESPVPEPATWAMMIVGFGAVGGVMRRRRDRTSVRFA